jgi:hypothetical protein
MCEIMSHDYYEYSFEDHNEMNSIYIYGVFPFRGWWHQNVYVRHIFRGVGIWGFKAW